MCCVALGNIQENICNILPIETDVSQFIEIAAKYTELKELTKPVLNELIDKIVVFDAEKKDGKRTQRVDIYLIRSYTTRHLYPIRVSYLR